MDALIHYITQPQNYLPLIFILVIVAVLPLLAGYVVLMERKIMADMQARLGPMRVGPHGLLQPLADAVKLLIKEDIIPEEADKVVFLLAPLISVTAAMTAYAAIPFGPGFQIAEMNIGLLFILAISSMGIFGIVLAGWASNNHYSLLGALRGAAQLVSYEVAAGLAIVTAVLLAGTISTRQLVIAQISVESGTGYWFIFLAPVAFFIYLVASVAETNRAPFDLPEAESELVAGYMTEYSGFRWSIFFLAEYANMIVVASIATILFLGGWSRPFANTPVFDFLEYAPPVLLGGMGLYCLYRLLKQPAMWQKVVMLIFAGILLLLAGAVALPLTGAQLGSVNVADWKPAIHGGFWFVFKIVSYLYFFMWIRFTFPRYRFDQLMRLGWHFLIPVSLVNIFAIGAALVLGRQLVGGWGMEWLIPANLVTLGSAFLFAWLAERRPLTHAVESEF
jgi:NADH-quinone oxidoreductase subunit H